MSATLLLLMRETRSSAGNAITRRVLVDADKKWGEQIKGVVVRQGEGKEAMATGVMA